MKNLIIFIIFLVCGYIYPQLMQERIVSFKSTNEISIEVLDISKDGSILIKESYNENSTNYYLYRLDNTEKVFLFSSSNNRKEGAWFSQNQDFIVFRSVEKDKMSIKIFDLKNNQIKNITHDLDNVVSASIHDLNNIMYQVRSPEEIPQIYYLKENKETFFVNGIGEMWSPNGKWVLVRDVGVIKSKKNNEKTENENALYSIYSKDRVKVITLSDFKNVVDIKWAPDSHKLLISELGDKGFYILYLIANGDELKIKDKYHFEGFEKSDSYNSFVVNPEWNLTGDQVLYIKTIEDGEKIYESKLWLYSENNRSHKQIFSTPNTIIKIGFNLTGQVILSEEQQNKEREINIIKVNLK